MENHARNRGDETQFVFQAPDGATQLLVLEFVRSRGLEASVPGRSRRRVTVRARKQEADSLASEVRRLVNQLHVMQVKAVAQVMEENGVSVSPKFSSLIATLEAKASERMAGSKRKVTG